MTAQPTLAPLCFAKVGHPGFSSVSSQLRCAKVGHRVLTGSGSWKLFAQEVVDVAELVGDQVQFAGEVLDLRFGAAVYVKVQFAAQAVFLILAVLAHHDYGRLDGGEHGQEEVEQDEGIGIPRLGSERDIDGGVDAKHDGKDDDEGP